MNFRLRCHLAFLPLFLGLTVAAAGLAWIVETRQVAWGLRETARTNALSLAAFVDLRRTDPGRSPWPARQLQAARISRSVGGLTITWFEPDAAAWHGRVLFEDGGLEAAAEPDAAVVAETRRGGSVVELRRRPDAAYDETVAYAGVFAGEAMKAIVAVVGRDETSRVERARWWRTTMILGLASLIAGMAVAEVVTRRARRDLDRVTQGSAALAAGRHGYDWQPAAVEELDDLSSTLRMIDRILQDGAIQARRRFLRSGHQLADEEIAISCHRAAVTADISLEAEPPCLVRRIHGSDPDDFWALQPAGNDWWLLTGRLRLPEGAGAAVQRSVRADAARDHACGLLAGSDPAAVWTEVNAAFPLDRAVLVRVSDRAHEPDVFTFGTAEPVLEVVRLAGRRMPSAAGVAIAVDPDAEAPVVVVGTLDARSLRLAREYLRHSPPGSLLRAADELAALLAGRDRGLLIILSLP